MTKPAIFILLSLIFLSFCSSNGKIKTKPSPDAPMKPGRQDIYQVGIASWYGKEFDKKRTANGEIYDMNKLTAAHKELPFNTFVEVKNLENGRKVLVRINDRGPFIEGRIIDLSRKAAERIGCLGPGTAPVSLKIVKPGRTTAEPPPKPIDFGTTPEPKAGFYLQAGAFGKEENARRMIRRLAKILPEIPFRVELQEGLYKVISETFPSRIKAEQYQAYLEDWHIEVFIKEEPTLTP